MKMHEALAALSKDLLVANMKLLGEECPVTEDEILIKIMENRLLETDTMALLFETASPREIDFFEALIQNPMKKAVRSSDVMHLASFGYIFLRGTDAIIPDEVLDKYEKIRTDDSFYKNRDVFWPFIEYLNAFAALYGVISQDTAIEFFKYYEGSYISENALKVAVGVSAIRNNLFGVKRGLIIHNDILTEGDKAIDEFIMLQSKGSYYLPPKGRILKYADSRYYDKTKQYFATRRFLQRHSDADDRLLCRIMDFVSQEMCEDTDVDELMNELEKRGVSFGGSEPANELKTFLTEQLRNTRFRINRGFTTAEISNIQRRGEEFSYNKKNISRDDPCPCGSGKKYKDCCGNILIFTHARGS